VERATRRAAAPALEDLAARLSDRFETRVSVAMGARRGKLTVEFATLEDLDRILGTLAPEDPGVGALEGLADASEASGASGDDDGLGGGADGAGGAERV
jgi:ParB family chromosome partitioning protein